MSDKDFLEYTRKVKDIQDRANKATNLQEISKLELELKQLHNLYFNV